MALMRYNPFRDLQRTQRDLDKLWESEWGFLPAFAETAPIDLYEEGGKVTAEVSLPSFTKKEIKITAEGGILEISAEHRESETEEGERRYYIHESSNRYLRRISLPAGANTQETEAEFKDGVLKVSMPTEPKKDAKTVTIK